MSRPGLGAKAGFVAGLMLVALPAGAQDFTYDPAILTACLEAGSDDGSACIGKAASVCLEGEGGSTTVGTVSCLGAERDQWAMFLAEFYDSLKVEAEKADAELAQLGSAAEPQLPRLQAMKANWAAFRDEACAWEASRFGGGTGAGPAAMGCDMHLTAQQALYLRKFDDGPKD